jgi:uncharacterized repeat protein (TIGR03803 family)
MRMRSRKREMIYKARPGATAPVGWCKRLGMLCLFLATTAIALAQNEEPLSNSVKFTHLVDFDSSNGNVPRSSLVQGRDGNLYGTTYYGGYYGAAPFAGTVFRVTPTGTLKTLYSFCAQTNCLDGYGPNGLVLATDGNFYGTTEFGGVFNNSFYCGTQIVGCGTVFKITPSGTLTTLYSFCAQTNCTDGNNPNGATLVQGTDGNFYGTTVGGGTNGGGTVFKITPKGALTTLYSFCARTNCSDGQQPYAGLVQASDGNFYGTTACFGVYCVGNGTVFKMTPGGTLTTLHRFDFFDGSVPLTPLVQADNGNLYGTTSAGGADSGFGNGFGTVFEITLRGALTTLHNFDGTDGTSPTALVQATDGNFYGATTSGANNNMACVGGCGTIFKITPGSALTTLYSFDGTDGGNAHAGLVQATDGTLYGTTAYGGAHYNGTVFSLSVGLGSFVEPVTHSGTVGNSIEFLGQGFTSSTTVSFNGKAAIRKVVSGTYLTATVPNDATTGFVTVTTSEGTLKSNKIFRVIPQVTSFSPTSGPVGTCVEITGESLEGATSVTFDGVEAKFTVDSYTRIMATVPKGAKTGKIDVTTAGGTATTVGAFTVN